MSEEKLPDFYGKVIVIYVSNAPHGIQDGIMLEFASLEQYAGRLFIVGRVPSIDGSSGDWSANLQGGVAWDSVTHYLIFDSREDYIRRMPKPAKPLLQRVFG
jgi:hypothetical protein